MRSNYLYEEKPGFDRLHVFGAGGHGREVCWLVEQCWDESVEVVFLVDGAEFLVDGVSGRPVLLLQDHRPNSGGFYVAAMGNSMDRERASARCEAAGLRPVSIAHPRVEASRKVRWGKGCVVFAGSILTTNVALGDHVHVNVHCSLSHDVSVGDYSTLSPGVHISGNVSIGKHVFFGTGSSVVNGNAGAPLVIGDGAVIAAGACVTGPVDAGAMVAGVPALRKR